VALAYFITFSTYGTWLHGTEKGKGSVDRDHNGYATPFLEPDVNRQSDERNAMVQAPYLLDEARREVVRNAIVALAEQKQWRLFALHVRSNHVHAVISADRDPDRLMSELKARASKELTAAGFENSDRKRWTRHGSTLHLFDETTVREKIAYALHEQGKPMAIFDGTAEMDR